MYNDSFKLRYKTAPIAISETDTFFPTKPHNHSEIEMLLILRGKSQVRINGSVFEAAAGDLIFVNPLEVHSLIADRTEDYCHRCICFDISLISDSALIKGFKEGRAVLPYLIPKNSEHNGSLSEKFAELYSAVERDGATLNLEVCGFINLMLAYLIKNSLMCENSGLKENTVFCDRVLKYISENYKEEISSKQAADALSFNQSYFCRSFKRNFGMSFSAYLNMYRISASKKLIENSGKAIADIAFECGFPNPDYFTKCFKKLMGLSPNEYKKSI